MLYLCATPIGNLKDITLRVLEILETVDLIACEDTRHTQKLLHHYKIHTPTTSLHEHNEKEKSAFLIQELLKGKTIALVSDAGMPTISDPGYLFVQQCQEHNIKVSVAPGATASISALAVSGLPTHRFAFWGFLSKQNKTRKNELLALAKETKTIILYESPHHLKETLSDLHKTLGNRKMTIIRELTKMYEEIRTGYLSDHIDFYEDLNPKGEFVLVLEGADEKELTKQKAETWQLVPIEVHMALYLHRMTEKEAMKEVAKDRGLSNREVYQQYKIDT